MEEIDPQSTIRPRFFDPDMAEVASFHHRSKIYESHLKQVRIILWVTLIVIISLKLTHVFRSKLTHPLTGGSVG